MPIEGVCEEYKTCQDCGAECNGAPVCCLCMKYPYDAARPLCDKCFEKNHRHPKLMKGIPNG